MSDTDKTVERELDRVRSLPWQALFYKTVKNETVPGGKVDMYMLMDDDTGEGIVTLGVPHGQSWLATYVAACCADPYFVRVRNAGDTSVALALHNALKSFVGKDGLIDGREVHAACMALIEAYVEPMPQRARQPLIDNTMKILRRIRETP